MNFPKAFRIFPMARPISGGMVLNALQMLRKQMRSESRSQPMNCIKDFA